MNKISVTSDTKGKLRKMISGVVFSDPYVFVSEFFQNAQRAKATRVEITYSKLDGELSFYDNGKGLKKPQDILMLDYSSWDSTNEGFGMGFWSWLGFNKNGTEEEPIEVTCEIQSKNMHISLSKHQLLNNDEPNAILIKPETEVLGFKVTLKSEALKDDYVAYELRDVINKNGELMLFDVYFNNWIIEKKDIFATVTGVFTKEFSNRFFDAKFGINPDSDSIEIYYEKRKVCDFYTHASVSAVIELKRGALSLREPDRKDYARDDKYYNFKDVVQKCHKEIYKDFVKIATEDEMNDFSYEIQCHLEVNDYARYLEIEDTIFEKSEETRNVLNNDDEDKAETTTEKINKYFALKNFNADFNSYENNMSAVDEANISYLLNVISNTGMWVKTHETKPNDEYWQKTMLTESLFESVNEVVIGGVVWRKTAGEIDEDSFRLADEDTTSSITYNATRSRKTKKPLMEVINLSKKRVWVRLKEVEEYSNMIAKAKYYNIKVFVAKNILYEKVFYAKEIFHISEVENGITKRNIIKNIELRTDKEKRFIELLQPICKFYNLKSNTFFIGELELYIEARLGDVVVDREYLKNTKKNIQIWGVADGGRIVLDRRAIALRNFHFSNIVSFGKNELRAVFNSLGTISHELAHLMYQTEDNTIEHFKKIEEIQGELTQLLISQN